MDKAEAQSILHEELVAFRKLPYRRLKELIAAPQTKAVRGPSGAEYQLEIQVVLDNQPGGVLRVLASIDDGTWSALRPQCDDFLVAPDGTFVDE